MKNLLFVASLIIVAWSLGLALKEFYYHSYTYALVDLFIAFIWGLNLKEGWKKLHE